MRKFKRRWMIGLSILFVLVLAINIAAIIFRAHADLYLGRGEAVITMQQGSEDWDSEYYKIDYASSSELERAAEALVREIESEGIVLMKNNGALPLQTSASDPAKITLLGRDAADPVYSGSGSGSVDLSSVVDLRTALEAANYDINETAYAELSNYAAYSMKTGAFGPEKDYENPRAKIVMDAPDESTYYVGEMPVEGYTDEAVASFDTYNDAAIIMYGRGGGEGGDLTLDMEGFDENYVEGQHQLELNQNEKDVLELAKAHFNTVIVLINASTPVELGILEEDEGVDAILWVGSPGQTGFYAVGDVLSGVVTPSGHTADIYPADFTADPTFVNFGHYQYENISGANANGDGFFVQCEEGIYIGYRYYETAAAEGFIDYDEAVVYPFGYGLSYTSFDWEIVGQDLGDVNGTITIDVQVTNTGSEFSGKDVVQLYFSPPYYEGGIEKSEVVLGDFEKTDLLAPGESQTVSLSIAVQDMASYDYEEARAWVIEAGDYGIRIQRDSHNMMEGIEEIVYTVDDTIVYSGENYRASDFAEVTNQFDDVSAMFSDTPQEGMAISMSRSDFAGTFPTAPEGADFIATEAIIEAFQPYDPSEHLDPDAEMPTTGVDSGLSLINMRGLDFDDPLWGQLLDELDPSKDIAGIVIDSAYKTQSIASIDKPQTVELDGPAGISAFMGSTSGVAYPSQVIVASMWNSELAHAMGEMIGNEALRHDVNGWYAPGVNLHRSQFGGRNFEYYSEDPVLSGKLATAVVSGAADKGVYTAIKHFALNEQETNRNNNGVATWANEQAIRELYLKAFELPVKDARTTIQYIADEEGTIAEMEMRAATAIMSSFNRIGATWSGGSSALMDTVLRDEWGFEGFGISDFNLYPHMFVNQGLAAGTDINITFESMKSIQDTESATAVEDLRRAGHRLLYTLAHSNAMNGIVPGATVSYTMATWVKVLIAIDIVVGLLLIAGVWYVIRKSSQVSAASGGRRKAA